MDKKKNTGKNNKNNTKFNLVYEYIYMDGINDATCEYFSSENCVCLLEQYNMLKRRFDDRGKNLSLTLFVHQL